LSVGGTTKINWDTSKPDGTFEKRTDITRLKIIYPEFSPRNLHDGVMELLNDFKQVSRILNTTKFITLDGDKSP